MSSKASVNPFFTPTQISGCQLWLDAADTSVLSLSGSTTVTAWRDKASNISFTGVNNPQTGTARINGLNVMDVFTNANSFFSNASFSFSTPYSIFGVGITKTTVNNDAVAFLGGITDQYLAIQLQNTSPQQLNTWPRGPSGWAYNSAYASNLINTNILVGMTVAAGSVLPTPYLNGSSLSLFESANSATTTITGLQIGNRASIIPWKGYIGEVLIYNQVLSTSQRQQLEGYLAWKWGLQGSLPATHPYKNSPIPPLLSPPTSLPSLITNTLFLPTQISGCQLWLDGADPFGNGVVPTWGLVPTWVDKSGNGRNATNSSPALVRPNAINNNPAIFFNGTASSYNGSISITGTVFFAFLVFVSGLSSGTEGMRYLAFSGPGCADWNCSTTAIAFLYDTNRMQTWRNSATTTNLTCPAQGTPILATTYYNGSIAYNSLFGGTSSSAIGSSGSFNINSYSFAGGNVACRGYIAEIILYTTSLTTAQQQQIEGYLAWKWGIQSSLAANFPYKSSFLPPLLNPPTAKPSLRFTTWQPNQISGLSLWLDATDSATITLSGMSVTSVVEKAQNITLTTQGTSSFLTVTKSINGNQTLFFNNTSGVNVYLRGTFNNLLIGSFFVVWQAASQFTVDYHALYAWQSQGGFNFPVFGYVNSATLVAPYTTFVGAGTPTTSVSNGTNYLTFYSWTGTTTNVGFNGATPTSGTQAAYASSSSVFTIMGEIGASLATTSGYVGEMIFYNSVLSTTERQNVEGYLAWKWGLQGSLPATHPYAKWPPSP